MGTMALRLRLAADRARIRRDGFGDALERIRGSGLFDVVYYLEMNPDVRVSGRDPLVHYMIEGAREGRDPHPLFDTDFYGNAHPESWARGSNPLAHYLVEGARRGLDPHPLFDTSYYLERHPELVDRGVNPLAHYLTEGTEIAGDPHPFFDASWYRERNPDVVAAGMDPLIHFTRYGWREGRDPHPLFETAFYMEQMGIPGPPPENLLFRFLREGPDERFDPVSDSGPLPDTGVCIVTPDTEGPVKNGGVGTACYQLARALAAAGYTVTVLFTGPLTRSRFAHWRNDYARRGLAFAALDPDPPAIPAIASSWFFDRSWQVYEFLRARRFTVIHFQEWQANGFWSIKAKKTAMAFSTTPLTVTLHCGTRWIDEGMQRFPADPPDSAKLTWAENYCIENADVVLSPSHYMLQWVEGNGVRLPAARHVMRYVYLEPPAIRDRETPAAAATAPSPDHLVFFGRLETRKGLHVFCDALRLLRREGSPLPGLISFLGKEGLVLDRPASEYIDELRRDLPGVEFAVLTDLDAPRALRYIVESGGLAVIPSLRDNYPLVILECITLGIPFLAARTGGIPEMADARVTFEPTAAGLAAALRNRRLMDHAGMNHLYDPVSARDAFLALQRRLQAPTQTVTSPDLVPAPRVTVCIPFFRHERYLPRLLDCLGGQSYQSCEVVVVNDGSGDASAREFERIAAEHADSRFRFLSTPNGGPAAARNHAAAAANGELLIFFDADNLPTSDDFVAALVRALQHSGADCVSVAHYIVDVSGERPGEHEILYCRRPLGACVEAALFENVLGDATFVIRRDVFDALGGFPEHAAAREDYAFLLKLVFRGYRLESTPDALYYYRRDPRGRNLQAAIYQSYQGALRELEGAPAGRLARFVATIGIPMLVARYNLAPPARTVPVPTEPRPDETAADATPPRANEALPSTPAPTGRTSWSDRFHRVRGFLLYHFAPRKTFVMITCSMRSGSTLLKALLAEADDVSNLPEVSLRNYEGMNRYAAYSRLGRLSRRRIMVFKRPGLPAVPFTAGFLRLKVIVLTRDAPEVADSITRMTEVARQVFPARWTIAQALEYWCDVYERILVDRRLAEHELRYVRYEDLIARPLDVTQELFEFIGSSRREGTERYHRPGSFEWRWGSDDGGERIQALEVQSGGPNHAALKDLRPGVLAMPRVRRLRAQLGYL